MSPLGQRLAREALQIRREYLTAHHRVQAGHIGTGLSSIDILTYLYCHAMAQEDTFILSKGHGASALYVTLHHTKRLTAAEYATYYQEGTLLPAHPAPGALAAIPAATGSLGHGLPIANGIAYARHVLKAPGGKVFALLSDGECDEGSVWEAALFAAHHHLENLTVVIDANALQGFGRTEDVLRLEPFADKWKAFGFTVTDVNGHDFEALDRAFEMPTGGQPRCIIARTVKGKGVSFLEDQLSSHYLPINDAQLAQAMSDLDRAAKALESAQ